VIYLIGGPPRVGKSSLAAFLAGRTGASWCPTDYLASAINPYGTGPDGTRGPSRLLPEAGNDERYTAFSTEEIIANYRARAAHHQLGIIRGFVEYAAADDRDFVVEGFHLEPGPMVEVQRRWPERIRCLIMIRTDQAAVASSLPRGPANDWVVRATRQAETFERIAAMVVRYGQILASEAQDCGCPVFDAVHAELDQVLPQAARVLAPEVDQLGTSIGSPGPQTSGRHG
jgi:2-phosphoglycerate kinase